MFKNLMRIFISIIGALFILYGIVWSMLGILGEKSTGLITDVRREMGELNNPKSGSYAYNISYSFALPDGNVVNGTAKEISDGVYIKHPNRNVIVRYLKAFPQINTLEQDAGFDVGKIAMILLGNFMVIIVNKY